MVLQWCRNPRGFLRSSAMNQLIIRSEDFLGILNEVDDAVYSVRHVDIFVVFKNVLGCFYFIFVKWYHRDLGRWPLLLSSSFFNCLLIFGPPYLAAKWRLVCLSLSSICGSFTNLFTKSSFLWAFQTVVNVSSWFRRVWKLSLCKGFCSISTSSSDGLLVVIF